MERRTDRHGFTSPLIFCTVVFCTIVAFVAAGWMLSSLFAFDTETANTSTRLTDIAGREEALPSSTDAATRYAVTIRPGPNIPRIDLGTRDHQDSAITASCRTCHSTRPANKSNKQASDLDEFHQGLTFSHHSLSCLSCHNPDDYDTLHLADGTPVAYPDVMTLCAQCHGIQFRDYEHGAHGGMTGYWDLSRGPRVRNNCVDCHHPHAPQFPQMQPIFKPRDRFLSRGDEHEIRSHD